MPQNSHLTEVESERGKKKCTETMLCNSSDAKKAWKVQPVATISCSYLHNGFSNVLKWLLHKFTDTMDLPSGYDKVLWLIRLQHQPHGLRENKQRQIWCKCKWPLWYMILYCCIFDLQITHTRMPLAWEISTFLIWWLLTSSAQLWKEFNCFLLQKTMLYLIFNLFHSRDFFRGDFNMFTFELRGLL